MPRDIQEVKVLLVFQVLRDQQDHRDAGVLREFRVYRECKG